MTPKIRSIVETFIEDLTDAIREEGAAAFAAALGGGGSTRAKSTPSKASPKPAKRPKGAKRSPEEIEQLVKSVESAIKKSDGLRSEGIAEAVGVETKDLPLVLKRLLSEKKIRSKGVRRGTTYFAK